VKTVQMEGPLSLWRGFIPMWVSRPMDSCGNLDFNSVIWCCTLSYSYSFWLLHRFKFSWARFAPMATLQLLTIEFLYSAFGFKSI
jgi:hypothetical protein